MYIELMYRSTELLRIIITLNKYNIVLCCIVQVWLNKCETEPLLQNKHSIISFAYVLNLLKDMIECLFCSRI